MAAPKQSDWTTEVDWTNQCEGIDWSHHPEPTEADNLLTTVGHLPKIRKFDGGVGMAFIDVEEQKSQERQKDKDAQALSGSVPGRWDHTERHKSHRRRFEQGQRHKKKMLGELVVHIVCRPDESIQLSNSLRQLCEKSHMVQMNQNDQDQPNETDKTHTDYFNFNNAISHSKHAVTFRGGVRELNHFFQAVEKLSSTLRSQIRCESSDFTLLGKFPNILRPLNGASIQFEENGTTYALPTAPQRRVKYNRSSLCRISNPMKLIDADYGKRDTVWIRIVSNNESTMINSQRRTKDELSREAGVFTEPHHPTKVFVPPPKPNVVEMGRGASTSAVLSHVPSPVRRSKPSGDIKNYLFKTATKWAKETERRDKEERRIQQELKDFLLRNNAVVVKRIPETPRGLKAMVEKKKRAEENKKMTTKKIALRKWRKSRIKDLKLIVSGLDLSNVSNTVLVRCRQIAQYGVRRVCDRHLRQRPPSPKLPEVQQTCADDDLEEDQPLTEEALLEEFFRKMRIVIGGDDSITDHELVTVLREPVDPVTGQSLLHVACSLQRVVHVKVLLALPQVDVNQYDETIQRRTSLHLTAAVGSVEITSLFLERSLSKPNIDATDNEAWTPLHVAAYAGHTGVVELLLPISGQQGKLQTNEGDSPLHLASRMGRDLTVEKMLLFYQSLPTKTATDTSTGTATESNNEHHAILLAPTTSSENDREVEHIDILRFTNNQGCTPLHVAAAHGHLNIVKRLASAFSPVKVGGCRLVMIRDECAEIPLMHAVRQSKHQCAIFLWNELINKSFRRVPKGDALHTLVLAVRAANHVMVRKICGDIDGIENAAIGIEEKLEGEGSSWTCVHLASYLGHSNVLAAMVSSGNPDMNTEDGNTMRPLDLTCMAGHRLASTVILDAGGVMGHETMNKRAKKLWKKALTTVSGSIRGGVAEQERLIKCLALCDAALTKAITTRNAVAIIEATDDYQEAKLALSEFRDYFLKGEERNVHYSRHLSRLG